MRRCRHKSKRGTRRSISSHPIYRSVSTSVISLGHPHIGSPAQKTYAVLAGWRGHRLLGKCHYKSSLVSLYPASPGPVCTVSIAAESLAGIEELGPCLSINSIHRAANGYPSSPRGCTSSMLRIVLADSQGRSKSSRIGGRKKSTRLRAPSLRLRAGLTAPSL